MPASCYAGLIFFAATAPIAPEKPATEKPATEKPAHAERQLTTEQRQQRINVVQGAFAASHDGWSADEVVIDDARNEQFLKRCRVALPETDDFDFNWTLLNLRESITPRGSIEDNCHSR